MPSPANSVTQPPYFRYWGKAAPKGEARYHLLAFHSLDVAACGQLLLELPRFGLKRISEELGYSPQHFQALFVAFLAVHDIGKFSRGFQGLAPDLGHPLMPPLREFGYTERHDTLGWIFLNHCYREADRFPGLKKAERGWSFWQDLFRVVTGHHGRPPKQTTGGQPLCVDRFFHAEDMDAAQGFLGDVFALWPDPHLPPVTERQGQAMKRLSWQLAGLAVLADWLGSDAAFFEYQEEPCALEEYWHQTALPAARRVLEQAGLRDQPERPWSGARTLFDFPAFTPLQRFAAETELAKGPQLFLLEDVTGSGKTEAALMLCHRLMAAGQASGLFFGLPTMATSNQLYRRLEPVYRKLFLGGNPSLVLSHGARDLVQGFRDSVLAPGPLPPDRNYGAKGQEPEEHSGTAQCSAWLADSRKKSMLADVGVGTVDQALLGVLPVRHQSLRLLGLAGKVLVIDEVHAYEPYTTTLLRTLVRAQTMVGGSTVLLSATVPGRLRSDLIDAFREGLPTDDSESLFAPEREPVPAERRYPLATQVTADGEVRVHACGTRADLVRRVEVAVLHSFADVAASILAQARAGAAVCWIRNTVEDARDAFRELQRHLPSEQLLLFHARFAMKDRLRIEDQVLQWFGKESEPAQRRGRVLVATQVAEQSLDLDFDALLSDLAPIDLVIQRAGRLHRHVREADGRLRKPDETASDGRSAPVLQLYAPEFTEAPTSDWYRHLFPRGSAVYPDAGKLWLTLAALTGAGCIVSPGEPGETGSVRALIEAVYGAGVEVPEALGRASREAAGKAMAEKSQGGLNALNFEGSYHDDPDKAWYSKGETPTRLGEESQTVYLAREVDGALQPWVTEGLSAWEMSAVRVRQGLLGELEPRWEARFRGQIDALRQKERLLSDEHEFVLPLALVNGDWIARCRRKNQPQTVRYSETMGLETEETKEID